MESICGQTWYAVASTHQGHRDNNEDAIVLVSGANTDRNQDDLLFGIVDGTGGCAAGEVAAAIVRDVLTSGFAADDGEPTDWIVHAHSAILEDSGRTVEHLGMGAIVSCGLISGGTLTIDHVDDTRLYRLQGGQLEQLSVDQSVAWDFVRAGQITKEMARIHPLNTIVNQVVGQAGGTCDVHDRTGRQVLGMQRWTN